MNKFKRIRPGPVILLLIMAVSASVLICGRDTLPQVIEDVSDMIYYHGLSRQVTERMEEDMRVLPSEIMLNENIAAWLVIDGTRINYPVMQERHGDEGYYLKRRPDGKYSKSGSLYIPSYDSVDSDQIIIYGHHMHNGTMFASLKKYKDYDWASDHRVVKLTTRDGTSVYEVFAVLVQNVRIRSFKWENYIDLGRYQDKLSFVAQCRRNAVVDLCDGNLHADTEYLTLITCDYSVPDGRLLVVCRKV